MELRLVDANAVSEAVRRLEEAATEYGRVQKHAGNAAAPIREDAWDRLTLRRKQFEDSISGSVTITTVEDREAYDREAYDNG